MDKPRNRPSVPDAIPLARVVYARHVVGCCLHVILDDDNFEQRHADSCLERAREQGHEDCIALAEVLVQMTNTQRHALYRRYDEYARG